jgi:aminomethyltransferase
MTDITPGTLQRTPLHDVHVALGAKIVPFAGYEMPVQYPTGTPAARNAGMGVSGPSANFR